MGAMQNNDRNPGRKKSTRGSTKNSSRLQALAQRAAAGDADWGGCDEGRLQAVIVAITALGGAVTFGLSRDNGAHSLTLMLDGGRETLWFNGNADLNEELNSVLGTLEAMS